MLDHRRPLAGTMALKHIAVGPRAHERRANVASAVRVFRFDPVSETALAPLLEGVSRLVSVVLILFFAAETWAFLSACFKVERKITPSKM